MGSVIVVVGPGSIGQAIARRVSAGKHVLLADLRQVNADTAAEILSNAGFEVSTATVDVSSRESVHALVQTAIALGDVTGIIHAAGVSRPGIIITPLAQDELTGPRGEGYRRMIELCPVGRPGTPDEVATVGALLMGADGAFITGSDFLMDGGVTAAYRFGELAPT